MEAHPYGWLSLLPPLVAIALAVVTRKATFSLLVGILCGALITSDWQIFQALYDTCEIHLWSTFIKPGKLRVFAFTLLMGAMIGVICRCGGMQGLIQLLSPFAKNRRGGQLITWLLGLLIFFDDYANTILLGNTLRPLCDRLKISREKLAYLVDSTAAPVAGLSLLSTWVAVEIEYVQEGIETLGDATSWKAIDLFVGSIPYRFYILASLMLVPMVAIMNRDFGPMWRAERRRQQPDFKADDIASKMDDFVDDVPARWYNAVVPIMVTLGVVMWLLYSTGKQNLVAAAGTEPQTLRNILGAAESSLALQYGALAGLLLSLFMAQTQRLVPWPDLMEAASKGAQVVLPAIAILWCASALSQMTGSRSVEGVQSSQPYEFKDHRLYTGDYLADMIVSPPSEGDEGQGTTSEMTMKLMPTIVFLLAAVLSFSTGTSFGTMGLLLPMVITLSHVLLSVGGEEASAYSPLLLASIGSVLAGAVFGDHCSPISDTTILSSQACACDHVSHVLTQMPYAILTGVVSIFLGTLPLGWGVSVWILLPAQAIALFTFMALVGKTTHDINEEIDAEFAQ